MEANFEKARHNMVEQQIRTWDVLDQRVLDAVLQTPREAYVPEVHRAKAFTDIQIPLGHGEVMMEPKMEARMLQALDVGRDNNVLEIGTGSGYVTALLARFAKHVDSVDIHPDFTASAAAKLEAHGIHNVKVETGDAALGWGDAGQYDVITVTGSIPGRTGDFERGLKIGGRLFVIVGDAPAMQAMLITRLGEKEFHRESLFETVIPPLVNAAQPQRFVF